VNREEINLVVDDLLDLYLLAGSLGDDLWKDEMLKKLQNQPKVNSTLSPALQRLWVEYKKVNMEILNLYNQIKSRKFTEALQEKIWNLKNQRMELSRKISVEEREC
jgi:hypothetical protein